MSVYHREAFKKVHYNSELKSTENDITVDVLPKLTEQNIKDLVPSIGLQIKISENIAKMTEVVSKYIQSNSKSNKANTRNVMLTPDTHRTCSACTVTQARSDIDEALSSGIPTCVSEDTQNSEIILDSEFNMSFFLKAKFPDFDLKTLLQTSPLGNSVLKFYETNRFLDNKRRTKLVDIIIKHLYTYIINNRLSHDEYNMLGAKILMAFPSEAMGTYYVPSIKKVQSPTGRSITARGKLVDKVRNLVANCGEAKVIRKRKRSEEIDASETIDPNFCSESNSADSLNATQDILWLKVNSEPWATVLVKWGNTFYIRQKQTSQTVGEFLKTWPILTDLRADVLINSDFERLFPQSGLNFFLYWKTFYTIILKLRKSGALVDTAAVELFQYLENKDENALNEDGELAVQLSLLPHLIAPKGRVSIGSKKFWKFTVLEAQQAIIIHVKNSAEINSTLEQLKEQSRIKRQTVQPYLLVEGDTLQELRSFYVVVDQIRYQFDTCAKAFDCLFKLYHVFSAKYPVQAEHLWIIIQRGVYQISTKYDRTPPYVLDILNALNVEKNT